MKQKVNPLVAQGFKVFVSYDNEEAFGRDRKSPISDYTWVDRRAPTQLFMDWIKHVAGPRDILWTTVKERGGLNIYFYDRKHAMLTKLRWG